MEKMKFALILLALAVVLLGSINAYAEDRLKCTLELIALDWEVRDGHKVALIDSAIVELLIFSPEEVLTWLSEKEDIKNALLSKWQYRVFTAYSEKHKQRLIPMKENLARTLMACNLRDDKLKSLRDTMLFELEKINIREID